LKRSRAIWAERSGVNPDMKAITGRHPYRTPIGDVFFAPEPLEAWRLFDHLATDILTFLEKKKVEGQ
jgi:hypothetical protein